MARRKRERKQAETEDEVKALARIDQLAEAVAERLSEGERARWTGLAVGLGFATLAGLIGMAIYMFLRRNSAAPVAGVLGDGQLPITIINQLPGVAKKPKKKKPALAPTASAPVHGDADDVDSRVVTPPDPAPAIPTRPVRLSPQAAIRLVTAVGPHTQRLFMRVQGPPNSFAAFATDARRLRQGVFDNAVVVVPAGQATEIMLSPEQVIYGISSNSNVTAAVLASQVVPTNAPLLSVVR